THRHPQRPGPRDRRPGRPAARGHPRHLPRRRRAAARPARHPRPRDVARRHPPEGTGPDPGRPPPAGGRMTATLELDTSNDTEFFTAAFAAFGQLELRSEQAVVDLADDVAARERATGPRGAGH